MHLLVALPGAYQLDCFAYIVHALIVVKLHSLWSSFLLRYEIRRARFDSSFISCT